MTLRFGLLLIPYVIAVLVRGRPNISYLAAWVGSFWILFLSLRGKIISLPEGRSLSRQLFRPIGLTQLIFAGYTALTSIFYFADVNGYYYLTHIPFIQAPHRKLALVAEAQRYYVLIHAGFTIGVLAIMDYRRSGAWKVRTGLDRPWFLLCLAVGLFVAAQATGLMPGLGQVQGRFETLAFVASVLSFAVSIARGRTGLIAINSLVYFANLVLAFLSGWKSEVLVAFILLAVFLYPFYRRAVLALAPPILIVLLVLLPTYAGIMRSLNWQGQVEKEAAAQIALDRSLRADASLAKTNWTFLTGRLSEIGMFTTYLEYVPDDHPYYGLELVEHGLVGLVPRVVWPGKPNMEELASQRVYDADVVQKGMRVSAKPKFVVDAYLSGGAFAVFLGGLLYGLLASLASRLAERWFGGYLLGSGLVYTALFKVFWMSNSFEFFFNTVFWSFAIMGGLFVAGRLTGVLVRDPARQ